MGTHPWRKVERAELHAGRRFYRGLVGPDTARRARWWNLFLACGHVVQRTARYAPLPEGTSQRGGTQQRSGNHVLPAPKRVRCEECPYA